MAILWLFFFSWENNIKVLSFALHIQCTNYETPILKANIGLQSCYPKQTEPKLCHDALLWLLSSRSVLNRLQPRECPLRKS